MAENTIKKTSIKKTSEKDLKNTPVNAKKSPLESKISKRSEITLPKAKIDTVGLVRAFLHNEVQAESWCESHKDLLPGIATIEDAKKALNIEE